MNFLLPYHVSNGGDGSANVEFHATLDEAVAQDEAELEGWGEPSADTIALKVEDGKLFFQDWKDIDGKFQPVWVEVTEK